MRFCIWDASRFHTFGLSIFFNLYGALFDVVSFLDERCRNIQHIRWINKRLCENKQRKKNVVRKFNIWLNKLKMMDNLLMNTYRRQCVLTSLAIRQLDSTRSSYELICNFFINKILIFEWNFNFVLSKN